MNTEEQRDYAKINAVAQTLNQLVTRVTEPGIFGIILSDIRKIVNEPDEVKKE